MIPLAPKIGIKHPQQIPHAGKPIELNHHLSGIMSAPLAADSGATEPTDPWRSAVVSAVDP